VFEIVFGVTDRPRPTGYVNIMKGKLLLMAICKCHWLENRHMLRGREGSVVIQLSNMV